MRSNSWRPQAWRPASTTGPWDAAAYPEHGGAHPTWTARVDAPRDILTGNGRTPAQGALAWLRERGPRTVPVPGFRSVVRAEENAGAIAKGALTAGQSAETDRVLGR